MSTRGYIGVKNNKGISYIYCHFDSYLEGVGRILKENYNDEEKVAKLIMGGNISNLGSSPEEDIEGWDLKNLINETIEEITPKKTLYYKTRGDKDAEAKLTPSKEEYINETINDVDFVYLCEDGTWKVYDADFGKFMEYEV